jgi:ketosteroid isomerase-like protein
MEKTKTSIFLEMIDLFRKLDVKTSMNYYAEDATYRYGSFPPVSGKSAIEAMANSSHLDFIEQMDLMCCRLGKWITR